MIKILHIYSGSQASGGLYLKEIVDKLEITGDYQQETIVSYYYPFHSKSKIFFRYTDLAANVKKTKLRLVLRFLELVCGLFYSMLFILKYKPDIVNYSLNSSFKIEYWFIVCSKYISKHKLYITCHDVLPFRSKIISMDKDIIRRKKFFDKADKLIVHNLQSEKDLVEYFKQSKDKIAFHSFPIMDLEKLNIDEQKFQLHEKFDFCFLGHLREEKGLNLLLEAWTLFNKKEPNASLIIAGNKASSTIDLNLELFKKKNITLIQKYLPDELYYNIILNSKTIVLPYIKGTNSGILSTIISTPINIIASDIPLFKNHPLIDNQLIFESNNINSLLSQLEKLYGNKYESTNRELQLEFYKKNFIKELKEIYK